MQNGAQKWIPLCIQIGSDLVRIERKLSLANYAIPLESHWRIRYISAPEVATENRLTGNVKMGIDYEQVESLRSVAEKADIHSRVFSFNVTAYRLWQDIAHSARMEAVKIMDAARDVSEPVEAAKPVVRWTEFQVSRDEYELFLFGLGSAFEQGRHGFYVLALDRLFDRPAVTYTREK
jgi:hypothetical protein